ncbi:GNAT family N-acetyltransferase [Virgibacillus siamensis]|uniref:GNAT family N-acetyltransferase n=1 Tax=Virgibacillus siamensis TaxID=480071 RepID=UPI0009867739|nr:GNAT family N-acetyltransferase [Virgibacillus siamensis]
MKIIQRNDQFARKYVQEKVIEHNMTKLPEELKTNKEELCFLLEDDHGDVIGGVTFTMYWQHIHLDFLWVEETLRLEGYGRMLLEHLEKFAVDNGCRLIFLDTLSFQAPEFYLKNGFQTFGVLEDHPKGFNQYFLQKRLMD